MNHLLLLLHVYISGNLQIVWGTWKNKEPNNVKKKTKQQPEQSAALLSNKLKYKIHVIYRPQKPT